jgi:ABC-type dipeptide/oligopeptide/nickel transport system permease subunit
LAELYITKKNSYKNIKYSRGKIYWKRVKQFVKELIRCRTAFLGAIIVLSFILVAIFAPFIAPHDPLKASIVNRLLWEPMKLAGIYCLGLSMGLEFQYWLDWLP